MFEINFSIIIVLIIILFQTLGPLNFLKCWSRDDVKETYSILLNILGPGNPIEIDGINGMIWLKNKYGFKKIILLDTEYCLLVNFPIKLFAYYHHIEFSQQARHDQLKQLLNLNPYINYDTYNQSINLKCNNWPETIHLVWILTRISMNEIALSDLPISYKENELADLQTYATKIRVLNSSHCILDNSI